jgi:hypothetical protein
LKSILRAFNFKFNKSNLKKPSFLVLIAANLYPVAAVLFFGWEVFLLLVLFWMENLVIGFFTVLKMLFAGGEKSGRLVKFSIIPFFCLHYGIFALVHGVFVFVLFGGVFSSDSAFIDLETPRQQFMSYQLSLGSLTLFISHGVSFVYNYIGAGEYKNSNPNNLMQQPYGRVVILHLTIIFGGFLMMLLGSPVAGLLLLIVLKTALDLRAHLREHDKAIDT